MKQTQQNKILEIPLTQGKVAIVDKNFGNLSKYKWRLQYDGYAVRTSSRKSDGIRTTIYMHRELLKVAKKQTIDHINRNKLDNRLENLRICTQSENNRNTLARRNSFIVFMQSNHKWVSLTFYNPNTLKTCKTYFAGNFPTAHIAALASDLWNIDLFGEFYKTNFKIVSHSSYEPK